MTHPTDRERRDYARGVILLILAALFWSLNGVLIKAVHEDGQGPPGIVIAFYRSLFAGLLILPLAKGKMNTLCAPSKVTTTATPRRRWMPRPAALACMIFYTLMTACFVVANTMTAASNAIILQYTSTFWIFGLSPFILKEYPRRRDLWILAAAVTGIAIIFLGNAQTDQTGLINALSAGLFFGLLTMMIRLMRNADAAAITVSNNLGSAVLLLPIVLIQADLLVSGKALLLLIIMGGIQFGLPYYLYSLGLERVPAYQACLLTLLEPVLVPLWTYLALGEMIPPATVAGGLLILATLVTYAWMSRRSQVAGQGDRGTRDHQRVKV
ncbi:MAG: DMT family transporter [Planctomycetota bacterium]|jgi:drug/metabolite transporter (DMT)-like permease